MPLPLFFQPLPYPLPLQPLRRWQFAYEVFGTGWTLAGTADDCAPVVPPARGDHGVAVPSAGFHADGGARGPTATTADYAPVVPPAGAAAGPARAACLGITGAPARAAYAIVPPDGVVVRPVVACVARWRAMHVVLASALARASAPPELLSTQIGDERVGWATVNAATRALATARARVASRLANALDIDGLGAETVLDAHLAFNAMLVDTDRLAARLIACEQSVRARLCAEQSRQPAFTENDDALLRGEVLQCAAAVERALLEIERGGARLAAAVPIALEAMLAASRRDWDVEAPDIVASEELCDTDAYSKGRGSHGARATLAVAAACADATCRWVRRCASQGAVGDRTAVVVDLPREHARVVVRAFQRRGLVGAGPGLVVYELLGIGKDTTDRSTFFRNRGETAMRVRCAWLPLATRDARCVVRVPKHSVVEFRPATAEVGRRLGVCVETRAVEHGALEIALSVANPRSELALDPQLPEELGTLRACGEELPIRRAIAVVEHPCGWATFVAYGTQNGAEFKCSCLSAFAHEDDVAFLATLRARPPLVRVDVPGGSLEDGDLVESANGVDMRDAKGRGVDAATYLSAAPGDGGRASSAMSRPTALLVRRAGATPRPPRRVGAWRSLARDRCVAVAAGVAHDIGAAITVAETAATSASDCAGMSQYELDRRRKMQQNAAFLRSIDVGTERRAAPIPCLALSLPPILGELAGSAPLARTRARVNIIIGQ